MYIYCIVMIQQVYRGKPGLAPTALQLLLYYYTLTSTRLPTLSEIVFNENDMTAFLNFLYHDYVKNLQCKILQLTFGFKARIIYQKMYILISDSE